MRTFRKLTAGLSLLLLAAASSAGDQIQVLIPVDKLDTRLAVPVNIQLPSNRSISAVEIFGNSGKYIKVSIPKGLDLKEISTRFVAVDREIGVSAYGLDGTKKTQIFQLDFDTPSVIPKESKSIDRQMGGGLVMRFEPRFSGYEIRRRPEGGQVRLIVRNAVSQSSFVEKVLLSFYESGSTYQVQIEGSPYWFEPFIGFQGTFSDVSVVSVVAK